MKRFLSAHSFSRSGEHHQAKRSWNMLLLMGGLLVSLTTSLSLAAQESKIVAEVNKTPITEYRLQHYLKSLGVAEEQWPKRQEQLREQLIDRILIQEFLTSRGITAPTATLDRQLAIIERILQKEGNLEVTLAKLGMTRQDLQAELSLPLAWKRYVRLTVTESQIADYFEKHRRELDGTKRQASQIFLKLPKEASSVQEQAALQKLTDIREQIELQQMSFTDAARKFSEAPSAAEGGNLGKFTAHGQMPAEISQQTFATDVGKLSEPFRSPYGAHLLLVQEEVPGQLSLEDARPQILERLSAQLWDQTVSRLRKSASIKITPL